MAGEGRFEAAAASLLATMSIMDGVKLGGELLQIQPRLPIIITTDYRSAMTDSKARELGFLALLSKPNTARTLGEVVHRGLQQWVSTGQKLVADWFEVFPHGKHGENTPYRRIHFCD